MALTLLILGYLLAVPPLVVFRKMWRRRWWLAYGAHMLGALCIASGWLLWGSTWAMAVNILWALGFGVAFPIHAGRRRRAWLVACTGLAASLLLGGAAYGLLRSRLSKTKVSKATEGEAFADFRHNQANLKGAAKGIPLPGVYRYAASGHYTVSVSGLGSDKRTLPETVPAVLVAEGRCWTLNLRYFKQHHRTIRYCARSGGGLRMMWLENRNEFFGLKHLAKSRCEPDIIYLPGDEPGHRRPQRCRRLEGKSRFGKTNAKASFTYLAAESMTIGGKKIRVHHVRRDLEVKSLQSATIMQHLWYSADTGMLVRYRVHGRGSGLATFKSDFQLTLLDLSPRR